MAYLNKFGQNDDYRRIWRDSSAAQKDTVFFTNSLFIFMNSLFIFMNGLFIFTNSLFIFMNASFSWVSGL